MASEAAAAGASAPSSSSSSSWSAALIHDKIAAHAAAAAAASATADGKPATHDGRKTFVSFEYYPPRTDDGVANFKGRMDKFEQQKPLYVDYTWGAGGSTAGKTQELAQFTQAEHHMEVNMHLTCTNMSFETIEAALKAAKAFGIRNICALRGDPPEGQDRWTGNDLKCGLDLVEHIRKTYGDEFGISVAGYPEGHPDAITAVGDAALSDSERLRLVKLRKPDGSVEQFVCRDDAYAKELAYLKSKVDAGANFVITQLFYDAQVFIQFVKDCRAAGIRVPIIPGIMPIAKHAGFVKMTGFCKTRVPDALWEQLEAIKDDDKKVKKFGIEFTSQLCQTVLDADPELAGLHFYTLNLPATTFAVMKTLGLLLPTPKKEPKAE